MLPNPRPRHRARTCLLAALALTVIALPATAAADAAYAGLGLGPGANLEGDWNRQLDTDGHAAGRLIAGYRFGPWSVEGSYFGTGLHRMVEPGSDYSISSIGLGGKFHLGLGRGVELYVRAGLDRTSLHAPRDPDGSPGTYNNFDGMGLDYGTGVTWLSQPVGGGSVRPRLGAFLDLGIHHTRITRDNAPTDLSGSSNTIILGFLASFDIHR